MKGDAHQDSPREAESTGTVGLGEQSELGWGPARGWTCAPSLPPRGLGESVGTGDL